MAALAAYISSQLQPIIVNHNLHKMYTKVYWIHMLANNARLGIMPRPRGGDWLDEEIANLKKQDVGVLVSLLEQNEIAELQLTNEQNFCLEHGIQYMHFPIKDRNVPTSKHSAMQLIDGLKNELAKGVSVIIHCRMGIGRSSIMAGAVLLDRMPLNDIITHISKVRGIKVPDTAEQLHWFNQLKL